MILYHGSYIPIEKPDLLHSRKTLDFGAGFYTTPIYEQAVSWANSLFIRKGKAVVSTYEFLQNPMLKSIPKNIKTLEFDAHSIEWLNFITKCRTGKDDNTDYDLIIGGVADDKVFDTITLYFENLISTDEAIKRLKYSKPNYQYCFKNQYVIDNFLHFKGFQVIK